MSGSASDQLRGCAQRGLTKAARLLAALGTVTLVAGQLCAQLATEELAALRVSILAAHRFR